MFVNDIDSLNLRVQAMRGIQRYMDIDPAMPTTGLFGLKVMTLIFSMRAFGIILYVFTKLLFSFFVSLITTTPFLLIT